MGAAAANLDNNAQTGLAGMSGPEGVRTDPLFIGDPLLKATSSDKFDPTIDIMTKVRTTFELFQDNMTRIGIGGFTFGSGGAIPAGHFDGKKPASHSFNADCPYPFVMEFDGRILISPDQNPHDPELVRKICQATSLKADPPAFCERWNQTVPLTRFYGYQAVDKGGQVGLEYEICLIRSNQWLETTDYWRHIFTPEEIHAQRQVRTLLRSHGAHYESLYVPMKTAQNLEAVWRITAMNALALWTKDRQHLGIELPTLEHTADDARMYIPKLPKPGTELHPLAAPRVYAWLNGETEGDGVRRPEWHIPAQAAEHVVAYAKELAQAPRVPFWVDFAQTLQKKLQYEKRAKQSDVNVAAQRVSANNDQ